MGDSEKNVLAATSVLEDSAVNGGAATESIADLLIDRVTFRKYRCPKEECRKTFDEPADLFSHIGTHVSVAFSLGGHWSSQKYPLPMAIQFLSTWSKHYNSLRGKILSARTAENPTRRGRTYQTTRRHT